MPTIPTPLQRNRIPSSTRRAAKTPAAGLRFGPDCPRPLPCTHDPRRTAGMFTAMMRQFELVERVKSYDPNADEDALNRAYVYSMQAHGHQTRASGDPYFSHPLEVAGILTGMRLDSASIVTALLHDTVEDTEATLEDIERLFGGEISRLVDGRHQAVPAGAAVGRQPARGELPQAGARDVRGHPGAAGEAGRPSPQHAHPELHPLRRQTPADRAGDHGDLCPARRADRHARGQGRARGLRLRRDQPGGPALGPQAPGVPAQDRRPDDHADRRVASGDPAVCRHRGRGVGAGEARLFDLAQDGAQERRVRAALRHHGVPRRRRQRRAVLPRAGRAAQPAHHGSGPLQGLHQPAEAERLQVDPHGRDRPGEPAHRDPDPHRGDAPDRRIRRGRALALQAERPIPAVGHHGRPAIRLAARPAGAAGLRLLARGVPGTYEDGYVPGPGVLLHAARRPDFAAQGGDRRRLRLRGAFGDRRPLRRRQGQRAAAPAAHGAAQRRPGRGRDLEDPDAVAGVGAVRRHRQGPLANPPVHPNPRAPGARDARPRDRAEGLSRGRPRVHREGRRWRAEEVRLQRLRGPLLPGRPGHLHGPPGGPYDLPGRPPEAEEHQAHRGSRAAGGHAGRRDPSGRRMAPPFRSAA